MKGCYIVFLIFAVVVAFVECFPLEPLKTIVRKPQYSSQQTLPMGDCEEYDERLQRIVYITRTGKRYHIDYCSYAKNPYDYMTIYEAKNEGYTACYYCF